jgi:hypothetical protein
MAARSTSCSKPSVMSELGLRLMNTCDFLTILALDSDEVVESERILLCANFH